MYESDGGVRNGQQLIKAFPNPCENELNLEFKELKKAIRIKMFGIDQKLYFSKSIYDNTEKIIKLNLGEVNYKGVMIVEIDYGRPKDFVKVIKL